LTCVFVWQLLKDNGAAGIAALHAKDAKIELEDSLASNLRGQTSQPQMVTVVPSSGLDGIQAPVARPTIQSLKLGNLADRPQPDVIFGRDSKLLTASGSLGMETVLLIIASDRPNYLQRTLAAVVKYHPRDAVPIVISEDGNDGQVQRVVDSARISLSAGSHLPFRHWHRPNDRSQKFENGYFRLAEHFRWALSEVFHDVSVRRVIILEEDIEVAPDFFEFFGAVAPLLEADKSLLAASAFNDNGFKGLVKDNKQLYRSDFFPGLGWMMTRYGPFVYCAYSLRRSMLRNLWEELAGKWPKAYWDDWLREVLVYLVVYDICYLSTAFAAQATPRPPHYSS
jgi:hypothetical protein